MDMTQEEYDAAMRRLVETRKLEELKALAEKVAPLSGPRVDAFRESLASRIKVFRTEGVV